MTGDDVPLVLCVACARDSHDDDVHRMVVFGRASSDSGRELGICQDCVITCIEAIVGKLFEREAKLWAHIAQGYGHGARP